MNDRDDWPAYITERASTPPPPGCGIIPESTPVISFGDPVQSVVATLGINPSRAEFLAPNGTLLRNDKRRLATLSSLGTQTYEALTPLDAAQIVDDCATYFDRRPYHWFKPLDRLLRAACDASYFEATACHLDLVQWATSPIWGQLEEAVRARLLACDQPFLTRQLQHEGYRTVLVNGRTALNWVEHAGIVKWTEIAKLPGPPTTSVYRGETRGARLMGWSCNLQSQPGALRHINALAKLVRDNAGEPGAGGAK